MNRCSWCEWSDVYREYHDIEWWIPVYDDLVLFEFLILEWAQAGLSWSTILNKRAGYKKAFKNFDPKICSKLTDIYLESLREDASIVRNKLKIYSVRKNARVFLDIQKKHGSFSDYLRAWVDHSPIINHWKTLEECPASTDLSELISKDLKKKWMTFVGSTIIYAYLQAVGVVDDHVVWCWRKS